MKRVFVVCEGQSEEKFIKEFLSPYFISLQIYLIPLMVPTSNTQKGGGLNYDRIEKFIINKFKEDTNAFITTMFDYYKLHKSFSQQQKNGKDIYNIAKSIEQTIYDNISNKIRIAKEQFFPYIQLHELESLVFCDINAIVEGDAEWFNNKTRYLSLLEEVISKYDTPEHINSTQETSPSHRLKEILKNPKYRKTSHITSILGKIGLQNIRNKCKHFDEWCKKIANIK